MSLLLQAPHSPSLPRPPSWRISLPVLGLTLWSLSCGFDPGSDPPAPAPKPSVAALAPAEARARLAVLREAGIAQVEKESWREAVESYQGVLALSRSIQDPRNEAGALRVLGAIEVQRKNPREGLRYLEPALSIWKGLRDQKEAIIELHNIGAAYQELGDLDRALAHYEEALPLWRGARHPDLGADFGADLLNAVAQLHSERGEIERARTQFKEALELSERSGDARIQAGVLDGVATLYRRTGELQKALEDYDRALRLSLDRSVTAKTHNYLAATYRELGDLDKALDQCRQALAIHRELKADLLTANNLADLGWIYLQREEPQAALDAFQQALGAGEEGEKNRRGRAAALHGRGAALRALGQAKAALAPLQQSLAIRAELRDPLGEASILLDLGQARQSLGQSRLAVADLERALSLADGAETLQAESLFRLAGLDRQEGRLSSALGRVGQAITLLQAVRADVASPLLRSTFLASRRDYHELEIEVLVRLAELRPAAAGYRRAFEASENARARGLLDLLAEGQIDIDRGISRQLKDQEEEIGTRLTRIQRRLLEELSAEKQDAGRIASLRRELDRVEDQRGQLDARIRREHPRYAAIRSPEPLLLPQAQALLDDRTVLLEYFLGKEGSFLFVVTREGLAAHRLPPAAELNARVQQVREGIGGRGGRRKLGKYKEAAHELYRQLIAPAAPVIAGRRLLIAADGDLHLLAFETLLTAKAGERAPQDLPYLLRDHAVSYVPSASVLAGLQKARSKAASGRPGAGRKQFLAFADPVLRGGAGAAGRVEAIGVGGGPATRGLLDGERGRLVPLPGSRTEVTRISRLYPPGESRIYLQGEATEENVKDNPLLSRAARIHFATHGVPDERQPDLAALVLTPDASSDGLLQVHEIFNLSLSADLVVLSACETGLGRQVSGEGLLGLTRAFLYAGAPSVVVSLWRVADQRSTPDLMVRFYRELDQAGDPAGDKAEALRQAKLALIRGGHAHPYYWAPFVLIGDPDGGPRR